MHLADPDLWNGGAPARLFPERLAGPPIARNVDLHNLHFLLREQALGAQAVGTVRRRINGDRVHALAAIGAICLNIFVGAARRQASSRSREALGGLCSARPSPP